jgi:hypothetical protein
VKNEYKFHKTDEFINFLLLILMYRLSGISEIKSKKVRKKFGYKKKVCTFAPALRERHIFASSGKRDIVGKERDWISV